MIRVDLKGSLGNLALCVAFEVPAQGITAIMGPSGSGKTTLLRAISGLERFDGTVEIGSATWQNGAHHVPVHQRGVGYLFQEPSLFDHLSVRGNLEFAARHGASAKREAIIAQTGIAHLLERAVSHLSGGERQRVALARALRSEPELLLMDEPLSSLDQSARRDLIPLIREVAERIPVIYVSHDPLEVARLTDHVLYLEKGRLIPRPHLSLDGLSLVEIEALALKALGAQL